MSQPYLKSVTCFKIGQWVNLSILKYNSCSYVLMTILTPAHACMHAWQHMNTEAAVTIYIFT